MSAFSNVLHSLHTIFGKGVFGSIADVTVEKPPSPSYQEWLERKAAVMKPGKRTYVIKSLWHNECSRCDHYLYQTQEEMDKEQGRLCVENYRTAFHALRDCFDEEWKKKYYGLASEDNAKVIKTLKKKWNKLFPTTEMSSVAEEMNFLVSIDPHFHQACKTQQYTPFLLDNYTNAILALSNLATTMEKSLMSELILIHLNEREFSLDANEPYTVMCWGEPAYIFLGGPLTERQVKWMKFAINVAHVPERESDQTRFEHNDEEAEPLATNEDLVS